MNQEMFHGDKDVRKDDKRLKERRVPHCNVGCVKFFVLTLAFSCSAETYSKILQKETNILMMVGCCFLMFTNLWDK